MRPVIGAMVTILLLCSATADANGELHSELDILMEVQPGGDVLVREQISLTGDLGDAALTRNLWVGPAPGAWPLWQSVEQIVVTDGAGNALAYRVRRYAEHINLDLLEPKAKIRIEYLFKRGATLSTDLARIDWNLSGLQWNASIDSVALELRSQGREDVGRGGFSYVVGYESDSVTLDPTKTESGIRWQIDEPIVAGEPVRAALEIERGTLQGQGAASVGELASMGGLTLWLLAGFAGIALVLLLIPARFSILATRGLVFVPVSAVAIVAWNATVYWMYESTYRPVAENLAGEAVINLALVGFVLAFAWKQARGLGRRTRGAYFAQFAWPAALVICMPLLFVDRQMMFFPLIALPIYVYWWRPSIALHFGVGTRRIAESVASAGEIKLKTLAAQFKLTDERLLELLGEHCQHSVVVERDAGAALSPEIAAMRSELAVCARCGGATVTDGMALLRCDYCGVEYASSREQKPAPPTPVVLESISTFFATLTTAMVAFTAAVALAIFSMELAGGSFVGALIGAAIGGVVLLIPTMFFHFIADNARTGKSLASAKLFLVLGLPLIVPLFVLRKLRSKRVRLFTGELAGHQLSHELKERGEWSLDEFQDYLETNPEDAEEVARYVSNHGIVDGVYDLRAKRLVSRALYREQAKEGSCGRCGGFYGVIGGRLTCHFCGDTPSESAATEEKA